VGPDFEDVYDDDTLRRLDPPAASPVRPTTGRHRLASAALVGVLWGAADALEDRPREPVVEEAPDPGREPVRGGYVHLVHGWPEATRVVLS
jgi:hypothetical protein